MAFRLERLAQDCGRDVVFAKLGDVHTLNRSYGLALPQYHHALSINPTCVKALRGVDRVEKLLRGEDDPASPHHPKHPTNNTAIDSDMSLDNSMHNNT